MSAPNSDEEKPIPVVILWGDKIFHFDSAEQALRAGFHIPKEEPTEDRNA